MSVDRLLPFTKNKRQKTMKWLMLLAFVAVAAGKLTTEEEIDMYMRKTARTFDLAVEEVKDCVKSTEMGEEDLMYANDLRNDDVLRMKRISCLIACCAKKKGIMVEMKINVPKVMESLIKIGLPMEGDEVDQIRDTLHACNREVTEEKDECKAIYDLGVCVRDKNEHRRDRKNHGLF